MANNLFVAGGKSPNPSGRPVGTKRSTKRNLERLANLILTVKEVKNNYDHMKPGSDRWQMQKELMSYLVAKPQADSLTPHEISELYNKLENVVRDAATKKAV